MKVDTNSQNNQAEKNQSSDFSQRNSQVVLENGTTFGLIRKDFASILKDTSGQDEMRFGEKNSEKLNDTNISKENSGDSNLSLKEQKQVGEEKRDSDRNSENHQDQSFGNFLVNHLSNRNEIGFLGARSILHIADLERIISAIRSQTVYDGKQISILLKRSVLQGLEIKLTFAKDKSVIAEFIAANENVKNQLNAKAEELLGILRNRGIKLAKLEISISSESKNEKDQNPHDFNNISGRNKSINSINKTNLIDSGQFDKFSDSDTSYQI